MAHMGASGPMYRLVCTCVWVLGPFGAKASGFKGCNKV